MIKKNLSILFFIVVFQYSFAINHSSLMDDIASQKTQEDQTIQKFSDAQAIFQASEKEVENAQMKALEEIAGKTDRKHAEESTSGNVLIFISFSMPEVSLKQWFNQARRLHAPLIIRGLVNNSFVETQQKIEQLTAGQKGGVVLDPRLFSDYQINQVPAVVVRDTTKRCSPTQSCLSIYPFDAVIGDIGLEDALNTMAQQEDGEAKEIAAHALQILRKSP